MLLYLDNWTSVRNAPNENQGRELLELHTVGRGAGLHRADGQGLGQAAVRLHRRRVEDLGAVVRPRRHTTGAVQVLGFGAANAAADGSALTVDYLRYLAHHPATATRIATKLCRHFVADQPSDALVAAVAKAFTDSGTDIKATLRALVAHPDFLAGRGLLVRNPVEDFVATCRVLGLKVLAPTDEQSFARACIWLPADHPALPVAAARRAAARRRRVVLGHPDAQLLPDALEPRGRLVADQGRHLPQVRRRLAAARPASGSTSTSTTSRALVLGKPADARTLAAVVGVTGYPASTVDQRDPPGRRLDARARDGRPARLPRPHDGDEDTDDADRRPSRCCREYEHGRRAVPPPLPRRAWPPPAPRRWRPPTFGDAFRQTAFGADPGGNVLVVLSPARRHRRPRHGRAARRPGVLHGPAHHRACPRRSLLATGRDVRPAPAAWRRCSGCGTAGELGRHARGRAAGAEPLALLRDGGGRGRRPRLDGAPRAGSTG